MQSLCCTFFIICLDFVKLKYLACAHVHSVISHFEMYLQVCLYAGEFAMFRFTDISVRLLFAGMLILQCV